MAAKIFTLKTVAAAILALAILGGSATAWAGWTCRTTCNPYFGCTTTCN